MIHQQHIDAHVGKILEAFPHLGETEEQLRMLAESAIAFLHAKQRREAIVANERLRQQQKQSAQSPRRMNWPGDM